MKTDTNRNYPNAFIVEAGKQVGVETLWEGDIDSHGPALIVKELVEGIRVPYPDFYLTRVEYFFDIDYLAVCIRIGGRYDTNLPN